MSTRHAVLCIPDNNCRILCRSCTANNKVTKHSCSTGNLSACWVNWIQARREGGLGQIPFQAKNGITNQAIVLEWQAPSETSKLPSMISEVSGPLVNDTVYLYLDTVYMEEPLLLLKQFHCCSPQCNTNSMYY